MGRRIAVDGRAHTAVAGKENAAGATAAVVIHACEAAVGEETTELGRTEDELAVPESVDRRREEMTSSVDAGGVGGKC